MTLNQPSMSFSSDSRTKRPASVSFLSAAHGPTGACDRPRQTSTSPQVCALLDIFTLSVSLCTSPNPASLYARSSKDHPSWIALFISPGWHELDTGLFIYSIVRGGGLHVGDFWRRRAHALPLPAKCLIKKSTMRPTRLIARIIGNHLRVNVELPTREADFQHSSRTATTIAPV